MLARGFDVYPTDGLAMTEQAKARLGRPVRAMRFDELTQEAAYDGVWANACLLHAPRSALSDILARIFTALRSGGVHVATFKAGGAEGRDGLGRYFNYLSADWEVLSVENDIGGDYEGGQRPWVAVTVRRPG